MKAAMNLALAILLSLGLTACGSSNNINLTPKAENPANPSNPENPSKPEKPNPPPIDDTDKAFIDMNDLNKTEFSFQKDQNDPKGQVTLYKSNEALTKLTIDNDIYAHNIANEFETGHQTPIDKYDEVLLDATYRGFIFLQGLRNDNEVDTRSLVLNLTDKSLTGHSVKTSENDLQLIFEPAKVKVDDKLGIRFSGYVDVIQGETRTKPKTNTYSGYVLGERGEEITGTVGVQDFKYGLYGVFITNKDKKLIIPSKKP